MNADGALDLPAELLLVIMSMLPAVNVLRCRRVCRRWRHVASDTLLWDRLLATVAPYSFNFWPSASLTAFGASIRCYSCWNGDDGERHTFVAWYGPTVGTEHQAAVVRSIVAAGGVLDEVKMNVQAFLDVHACLVRCRTVRLFDFDWAFVRDLPPLPAVETVQLIVWLSDDADKLTTLFPNLKTLHLTSTRIYEELPRLPSGLDCLHMETLDASCSDLTKVLTDVARPPRTIVVTQLALSLKADCNAWFAEWTASAWWPRVVEYTSVFEGVRRTVRRTKEIVTL